MQQISGRWMVPFRRKFSFGAVLSPGEKYLSVDTSAIRIAEYLATNFAKRGAV